MSKITVKQFAELIGKTPPRVRQMISEGLIKSAKKIGRDWLIDKKEVNKMLNRPNQRNRK